MTACHEWECTKKREVKAKWAWSSASFELFFFFLFQYGISGPYWYAGGATIQIILFAILSIMLKTRAPGAKTFLQVCLEHDNVACGVYVGAADAGHINFFASWLSLSTTRLTPAALPNSCNLQHSTIWLTFSFLNWSMQKLLTDFSIFQKAGPWWWLLQ